MVPVAIFVAVLLACARYKRWSLLLGLSSISMAVIVIWVLTISPSNDRDWWVELSRLPTIDVRSNELVIRDLRNFSWSGVRQFEPNWEKRTYDLDKLETLELIVEPFGDSELFAHTMLAFGFGEDGTLVVSIEARKELHEEYSLLAGSVRQFELIYVFGDERDLLTLRAVHRGSRLYMYPITANKAFMRTLLLNLASSANVLRGQPRFYRSIRDNCTTTLVKHLDRQLPQAIGLRYETVFPALAGRLLHQMGKMGTELDYAQAQTFFRVDEYVRRFEGDPDFSLKIRAVRSPAR